ncbi:CapA family protein [Lacrimispora sphenoides]|uniref:Poly-gamma-glutamate synthesis protein (Capsule biosynthesis protein) n=1 Tax=Lacrimispora sphenoides JCM 1415 TaxID=1297793 RepID=A0ABY1CBV4_9FIRM|nr:CapA family protein [Lacrimispora sphenoides]SET90157.1 poly-gamma-glutamate synthesis protein (capsule biosynthesis protein) [[Clostridium] sphenoides JCM 1415]SUY52191.1 capsule synthesis protein CapA [Lacrimispora sphenoides]
MKKKNGLMKILIFLPIVLFILLVGWIGVGEWNGKQAVPRESLTHSEPETSGETEVLTVEESQSQEETAPIEEETEQKSAVQLLFAGDILLSSHVMAAYDKVGDMNGVLDEGYRSEISNTDIFMANQEFPFSDRGSAAPDKQFTFRLPPSKVSLMNEIGVDIVTLANNHSLDYGTDALVDTCTALDGAGIKYVGAGPDMNRAKQLEKIEVNGKAIGFLGASRVYPDPDWVANSKKPGMVSGYDPTILLEEIKKAKEICDYLVVYVHWGVERDEKPQEYQRALGKQIIDAGADLVMGSHPHVLQGIEYYNGKPICYSLGNFIFGSSIPKTALIRAQVDFAQGSTTLSLVPGTSKAGYTRKLTQEDEIREFYQYFQSLSFDVSIDENGVIHNHNN